MDIDAQDEELADLHVDFAAREVDAAGAGDGAGDGLGCGDCSVDQIFVEGRLWMWMLAAGLIMPWAVCIERTFVLCASAWLMASLVM